MKCNIDMKLENTVIDCVAKALNLNHQDINLGSKNLDFDFWDSFGQIAIVSVIESEFLIQFSIEDIYNSTSVEAIISIVKKYVNLD